MSSTNKTANLGLSQWEQTDPFSREDINRDLQAIDEKVGQIAMVRLIDLTLEQSMDSVDLDLSQFDLTDIIELRIYFPGQSQMRMNHYTDHIQYLNSSGSWVEAGSGRVFITGRVDLINTSGLAGSEGTIYLHEIDEYCVEASKIGPLKTLSFNDSRAKAYAAGERFVVLGMRA